MTVPTFTLSDNTTIPAIGYGTGTKWYGGPSDQVSAGVATAIEAGFIHLDGAEMYKNEAGLGAGAKLSDPNERKKFYITTKVADGAADIPKALDESLRKLGTSYVDLYLLHSPFLPEGVTIESAWEQLVAAQAAGKVRSIGVSNFRVEDLEKLAKASAVKPVVNQIEFSPYLQNQTPGIFKYAKAHNITLEAYSPLGPLAAQAKAHAAFMERIQNEIQDRLKKEGIKGTVYGRVKHVYSIYRKMYAQNKKLSEIFDLYAFRVIVDDIPTCYSVLGCIHDMYKAVLGRFKDYIGTPKPNMYQSLHTTVIGSEGIPFEVQIRTWEMHHMAEYGVAAHWKYKQGLSNKQLGTEETFAWVRRLLENQQDTEAEEYIRSLKVDLFADEVFVFTPGGDVINLPAGATPIDFAYAIHSAVGNSMTGAKVNGRIVGFDYRLRSGEIVEVITSKNAKGPSRDWMKLAKSNQARTKIRQWFKREKREENVAHGRTMFEGEIKRLGLTIAMLTTESMLPHILEKVRFNSLEEMYAAIGYGGASAQKCANRAREELIHQDRQEAERLAAEKAEQEARQQEEVTAALDSGVAKSGNKKHSVSGVIVAGMTECMVKFAKCCTPVPGDPIVGFITRGYGVSVHRADCPNAISGQTRPGEKDRWIKVSWDPDSLNTYKTSLDIIAKDRPGLAMDVTTVMATAKMNILAMTVNVLPDGYTKFNLVVEVRGQGEVTTIMNKLNQVKNVYQVSRVSG